MMEKYYIFGCAIRGEQVHKVLRDSGKNIVYFIDNNKILHGTAINGTTIVSFDDAKSTFDENSIIVVTIIDGEKRKEVIRQIKSSDFTGKIFTSEEFHKSYEIPLLVSQRESQYEVDFKNSIQSWIDNLLSEVEFWAKDVACCEGDYYAHYLHRISPKSFDCNRINVDVKSNDIVLDVGCGLCTQYGDIVENGKIDLLGVDPLAFYYNNINEHFQKNHNLNYKIPKVGFGMFELLTYFYGTNYCDYLLIDNALDHCIDPVMSLVECLRVTKIGGMVSTLHHVNEAYKAYYKGLHQWNIGSYNDALYIWNEDNCINVSDLLSEYADIEVIKQDICTKESPYGLVICNMKKKKEIPVDFMRLEQESVGVLVREMMRKLADLEYAKEYIKICC